MKLDELHAAGWKTAKTGIGRTRAFAEAFLQRRLEAIIVPEPEKGDAAKPAEKAAEISAEMPSGNSPAAACLHGAEPEWTRNLYGGALIPDAVFYLEVAPEELVQRNLSKNATLDYWESGMDLGLSRDMFDSFLKYQGRIMEKFDRLRRLYDFEIVDGSRSPGEITADLRRHIEAVIQG